MNRGNPASSPPGATPGAGSPGNNIGSGGAAHPYTLPYSAGGGGHYPSYMSTGPYPDPGGAPGGPYEVRPMEYGGKYQFSGFQQSTPYYNNQPSPNEEGSGAPAPYYGAPGSMGSPTGGRDLNYFGYNNGFGAGESGGSGGGGPAFYPHQQQQQQHDNNNKTLGSDTNIPVSSSAGSGPSEVKSEVDQADPLSAGSAAAGGPTTTADKDNIPELSDLPGPHDLKFSARGHNPPGSGGHPAILGGSSNTELSDTKDNSDNQSTRSHHEQQSSPNPNSPRSSVAGVKRSHSPSNSENNDFGAGDPQQQQQPFEAMGPSSMNHGDEYMRQMSALNPQNEGKQTFTTRGFSQKLVLGFFLLSSQKKIVTFIF